MTPEPGIWGQVWMNTYIQDLTGTTWRVTALPGYTDSDQRIHTGVTMRNRAGQEHTMKRPPDNKPVTLMKQTMDEGVSIMQRVLGARVLSDGK